jgi:hypothetical protein
VFVNSDGFIWANAKLGAITAKLAKAESRKRGTAPPAKVDHRLIGSALARVHWELDILKR